jgi:anti-sigma regulatory factor (Ser/Thr protein kinase)
VREEVVTDLELATSEVTANAVEHGCPCDGGVIYLRVGLGGSAQVEICDCGEFKWDQPSRPLRGLGLKIIREMVDVLSIQPDAGRTMVRLAKTV